MPIAKRYLPDLLTANEISDLLGRTRSWWSQLVSAGVATPVDRAGPRGAARCCMDLFGVCFLTLM